MTAILDNYIFNKIEPEYLSLKRDICLSILAAILFFTEMCSILQGRNEVVVAMSACALYLHS